MAFSNADRKFLTFCFLTGILGNFVKDITAHHSKSKDGHFPIPPDEQNKDWFKAGQDELNDARRTARRRNTNVAKNVIMFVGDGLSLSTIWASRIYMGQYYKGVSGEEQQLEFEKWPHTGLIKTYNMDQQTTDSAAAATAFWSGVKTNTFVLGLTQAVKQDNCSGQDNHRVSTLLDWSMKKGKWTGIVTTTRITHATPAAGYAHSAQRDWEADTDLDDINMKYGCKDIARQLVEENSFIRVLLGGGRKKFLPNTKSDPEYPDTKGERTDGRNLIQEWLDDKVKRRKSHAFVWNKKQFDKINPRKIDYLLGLFEPSHMQYEMDRNKAEEPSLADMVDKSIRILQRSRKGFFLFVEAGRIDQAHHDGKARKALEDAVALDRAVKRANRLVSEKDTLMIVTSDHSFSFAGAGFNGRGNDILGFQDKGIADDGKPELPIGYMDGLNGLLPGESRADLTNVDTTDKDFRQQSLVRTPIGTHAGEDVTIYAQGPMGHLLQGVHEQNFIAHVLGYASCVGPNKLHCKNRK